MGPFQVFFCFFFFFANTFLLKELAVRLQIFKAQILHSSNVDPKG